MEQAILGMLEEHMMFADLDEIDRESLDNCASHDDSRELGRYNFEADDFTRCRIHLGHPDGQLRVQALRQLAYRRRFVAYRYDTKSIAPSEMQQNQRWPQTRTVAPATRASRLPKSLLICFLRHRNLRDGIDGFVGGWCSRAKSALERLAKDPAVTNCAISTDSSVTVAMAKCVAYGKQRDQSACAPALV
jgi:hypothetical protein